MKKFFAFTIAAITLICVTNATAQFSGGLEMGLPMSTFSEVAKVGVGASARFDTAIKNKISWTGSAGYLSFGGKDFTVGANTGNYGSISFIPISGGIKFYFSEDGTGVYAAADLGVNFISYSVLNPNSGGGGGYTIGSATATRIGLSPGIGYRVGSWDFAGRFNIVTDFTYLGLRAAYVFAGK